MRLAAKLHFGDRPIFGCGDARQEAGSTTTGIAVTAATFGIAARSGIARRVTRRASFSALGFNLDAAQEDAKDLGDIGQVLLQEPFDFLHIVRVKNSAPTVP